MSLILGNPPVFEVHPQNMTVLLNSNNLYFSLTCNTKEAAIYKWKREDGVISSSATGLTTNTLTFINVQPADSGKYYCIATNGSGTTSSNLAVITVKGSYLHR